MLPELPVILVKMASLVCKVLLVCPVQADLAVNVDSLANVGLSVLLAALVNVVPSV